jgi:hypothetical protein
MFLPSLLAETDAAVIDDVTAGRDLVPTPDSAN